MYDCHFCFHEILFSMRVNFHNITVRGRCVYGARTLCLRCEDVVFTVRGRCVYGARTICLHCEDAVLTLRGRCVYTARALCLPCEEAVFIMRGRCPNKKNTIVKYSLL